MKLMVHYNRHNFIILTLLFILSGISSYWLTRNVLLFELDESLTDAMGRVNSYVQTYHALPSSTAYDNMRIAVDVTDKPVVVPYLIYSESYIKVNGREHTGRTVVFSVALHGKIYRISMSKPLEGIRHITWAVVLITMTMILLLIGILAVVNRFFISKLWKPFYDTLNSLMSFRLNNPKTVEFKKSRIEEFRIMNDHLRMVTANAHKEYHVLKEFTENASHEFQTPLTIIRSKLDVLLQQDNFTEIQIELLTEAYGAVTKLSGLSRSLLLLTKIENNQFSEQREIALHDMVRQKASQFEEIWESRRISHLLEVRHCFVSINADLLEILLNNLFSNATRHNKPGGHIAVSLDAHSMNISNTGMEHALDGERVFSRFYKGTVNNENNGLGLSIVRQICISSHIHPSYEYRNGMHNFLLSWR
ncbi:HAMP domain-containing sensor histidine kinase [Chitinophaga sp. 212800010-3]|uniref:sensor histidine kinase n=1 Tax=unclassified Chitinophaga TaxID=2619133 RepID=UPI002DF676B3|nr:Histidine kinase domain-containing protein [Chitinophaga sp. 212800010-3]